MLRSSLRIRFLLGLLASAAFILGLSELLHLLRSRDSEMSKYGARDLTGPSAYSPPMSQFKHQPEHKQAWYSEKCFQGLLLLDNTTVASSASVDGLHDVLKAWRSSKHPHCLKILKYFEQVFRVSSQTGKVYLPDSLKMKFKERGFSNNLLDKLGQQTVTVITNKLSHESTVFNQLREKRPIRKPSVPEAQYVEDLTQTTAKDCDLCQYKQLTAVDGVGRLENKHAYIVANSFKLSAWHAMSVFRKHHPHNWKREEFLDVFKLAETWFEKVWDLQPAFKYPVMFWDLLPHSGASILHPHIQILAYPDQYTELVQVWFNIADTYNQQVPGHNYFTDMLAVHHSLGLAVTYGTAAAYVSLTPKKDHEVIIVSRQYDSDFLHLLYHVFRTLIDKLSKLCYSAVMALPEFSPGERSSNVPVFARIVSRGTVSEIRSDVSVLELYLASNVNVSPYKTIQALRDQLKTDTNTS